MLVEHLTLRRREDAAGRALQEWYAHVPLELAHQLGHRRLRNAEPACGRPQAAVFNGSYEGNERPELHTQIIRGIGQP